MSSRENQLPEPVSPLARLAVPAAALAATATWAGLAPSGADEAAYLGTLVAAVLASIAFLEPRPAFALATGGVLAALAVWVAPPGPLRGAVVLLVLLATVAVSAYRRLSRGEPQLGPAATLALALGLQLLLRGERLLHPRLDFRTLVVFLALPAAGAVATIVLSRRFGTGRALVVGAALLTLGPGWNVATTLAAMALAAATFLAEPVVLPLRLLAAGLVLAPIAWEPRSGLIVALAGLALAGRSFRGSAPAAAGAALLASLLLPVRPAAAAWSAAAWLPLLLPAAGSFLEGRRGRAEAATTLASSLLLAFAALRLAPAGPGLAPALAAPVALAALALPEEGAALRLQALWSAALLAVTALLAAYPWLRHDAAASALNLVGLAPRWSSAVLAVAAVATLALLGGLAARRGAPRRLPVATLFAGALLAAAVAALPAGSTRDLLSTEVVGLTAARPRFASDLTGLPVGEIVLDSSLAHAADLATGRPVASVRLRTADGVLHLWALRAGTDTSEWAAARPDVAARPGFAAPPAWISWVAPGREFWGRRYRTRMRLRPPRPALELSVERAPNLPSDVEVDLFQVEVRP